MTEEVRRVSATGGEKGEKLAQLGSVDPLALYKLAEVSGFGAAKYSRHNFLNGYDWSLSFDAMTRHMLQFWMGEDNDPESGLPHTLHAAWHGLALASFLLRGLGTDDRYKGADEALRAADEAFQHDLDALTTWVAYHSDDRSARRG